MGIACSAHIFFNTIDDMIGDRKLTFHKVFIIVVGTGTGENWSDEGQGSDERDDLELHGCSTFKLKVQMTLAGEHL